MSTWQIQKAKAHLSEVIKRAHFDGPQTITRHGAAQAVLMSIEHYLALSAKRPDFIAHLLGGPKVDGFDIPRDPDAGRSVDL